MTKLNKVIDLDLTGVEYTTAELYVRVGLIDLSEAVKEQYSFFD